MKAQEGERLPSLVGAATGHGTGAVEGRQERSAELPLC